MAAAAGPAADPTAEERFLREARVVSIRPLGEGITGSHRVELGDGRRSERALFKTVETRLDSSYSFGTETVKPYRDSYRHELAAYELDKLLGFGLVPATVQREIDGRKGSLQAWVERTLARFAPAQPPADMRRAHEAMHAMRLFDYLVFNTDRHVRNVVFRPDWRPTAIDNSIAFHAFQRPFRPLYRFPRGPVEKLRRLGARAIDEALGRYLEKDELGGVRRRRERALSEVDAAVARDGEAEALFDW
jgi:hypothetical protein